MLGMQAIGITYNGTTKGKDKWDRVQVSDIMTFELNPSLKKKLEAWNMSNQLAFRRYIYDRLTKDIPADNPKLKKKTQIRAQQKTFFLSALWHGYYPGFFFSFVHWMLVLQIIQELFRIEKHSKLFAKWRNNKIILFVENALVMYFLIYFGMGFAFLTI